MHFIFQAVPESDDFNDKRFPSAPARVRSPLKVCVFPFSKVILFPAMLVAVRLVRVFSE